MKKQHNSSKKTYIPKHPSKQEIKAQQSINKQQLLKIQFPKKQPLKKQTSKQPVQVIIQKLIMDAVYSQRQDIFRNKNRFEMILSEPNTGTKFEKVKSLFKGRYMCKNQNCTENKKQNFTKQKDISRSIYQGNQDDDQPKDYQTWQSWWQTQESTIKPDIKINYEMQNQSQNQANPNLQNSQIKTQTLSSQKQNLKWSSSLSIVAFNYRTYPISLDKFKQTYEKEKNTKLQIYYFIELYGQICHSCKSDTYCYPFFGSKQLKRIRKNFSSFIYNKIHNKKILKYKACKLRKLKGHKQQFCQACHLGQCRQQNLI